MVIKPTTINTQTLFSNEDKTLHDSEKRPQNSSKFIGSGKE